MSTRTTAQLASDFPVTSTKLLASSIGRFDGLVSAGFIADAFEVPQLTNSLGTALDALAEVFGAPTAVFTGTGGAVTRNYRLMPTYPLELPGGSAANAGGKYLNSLPGRPPQGRASASAAATPANAQDQRVRRYGLATAATTLAGLPTTLDAEDFVTITAPAVLHVPGVTFDVLVDDADNGVFAFIGNVAAGGTFEDKGQGPRNPYTPYAHTEVGYDGSQPVGSQIVYGPKTYLKGS